MGWKKVGRKVGKHISLMYPKQAARVADRLGWKRRQLDIDPTCDYCRRPLDERTATVDHKVPLSRGGTNSTLNYALACTACNQAKGSAAVGENGWLVKRNRSA